MKQITLSDMQQQSEAAASAPRLRAHRNFHPELSDPIQRLAIAMEPGKKGNALSCCVPAFFHIRRGGSWLFPNNKDSGNLDIPNN